MNNKKFNKLNEITDYKLLDLYQFLNKKEFFELARKMNINDIKIQRERGLLKFRRWEAKWPLPKEIEIKDELIKYGASRKNQKIIKRVIWAKVETLEEFQKRWSKNKAPQYWGNQSKIPYKIRNNWIWCKIHDNWVSDFRLKPDFVYKNKWLYFKIPKRYIGISYYSRDYHNNFILVPNKIKIDNTFFEGLGLQQGDGTQSLSGSHVTFTNGCYRLIEHQLGWFTNLGIHLNSIRIYPEIPKDKEKNFIQIKDKLISNGIKRCQFRKQKSKLPNTKNVLIQLVFHNKLFKLIYLHLLHDLRRTILEDKEKTENYLKGILASEGSIKLNSKILIPGSIKISASSRGRRDFYRKCFEKLAIKTSKDDLTKGSEAVVITHYDNFKLIKELNLLELHQQKQEKFINALGNYKARGKK